MQGAKQEYLNSLIRITDLKIRNYRNFAELDLKFSTNLIALIGKNGVGKTNILEAISLLAPGKGLRNVKTQNLYNFNNLKHYNGWSVELNFSDTNIQHNFKSFCKSENSNREILFDNDKLAQGYLSKFINIIWLTPVMDNLFIEQKSERRKFFDRIFYNLFPEHLQNLSRYDYYQKERLKILLNYAANNEWLNNIEMKLAELNIAIASVRVKTTQYLNAELELINNSYPKAFISFDGKIENLLVTEDNLKLLEQEIKTILKDSRQLDIEKKQTNFGIHKSDFICHDVLKNIPAQFASTGEQKSLLLSIILAEANLLRKYYNRTPILLLDEITSHLDNNNATLFINDLKKLDIQTFITGTSLEFFKKFSNIEIKEISI